MVITKFKLFFHIFPQNRIFEKHPMKMVTIFEMPENSSVYSKQVTIKMFNTFQNIRRLMGLLSILSHIFGSNY